MSTALMIRIGGLVLFLILIVAGIVRSNRMVKKFEKALQDRGASWTVGLGTCLSGLPGLDQPERVSCGGTATELIFLAEADLREICRIPWGSILSFYGGEEADTHAHLAAAGGLPSLILAQISHEGRRKDRFEPSFTVINWNDGSGWKQAVFEFRGKQIGPFKAQYLTVRNKIAGIPPRTAQLG